MSELINYGHAPAVKVRGQGLSRARWRGRQWAVTEFGIEALDGSYAVARKRLAENAESFGWPAQMATKEWVDLDDFCTAWLVALALYGAHVPPAHVRAAIDRAYAPVAGRDGGR